MIELPTKEDFDQITREEFNLRHTFSGFALSEAKKEILLLKQKIAKLINEKKEIKLAVKVHQHALENLRSKFDSLHKEAQVKDANIVRLKRELNRYKEYDGIIRRVDNHVKDAVIKHAENMCNECNVAMDCDELRKAMVRSGDRAYPADVLVEK